MGNVKACDVCQRVNFEAARSNILWGDMLLVFYEPPVVCHIYPKSEKYIQADICKACIKKLRQTCYRIRKKNQLEERPFDTIFKGEL